MYSDLEVKFVFQGVDTEKQFSFFDLFDWNSLTHEPYKDLFKRCQNFTAKEDNGDLGNSIRLTVAEMMDNMVVLALMTRAVKSRCSVDR